MTLPFKCWLYVWLIVFAFTTLNFALLLSAGSLSAFVWLVGMFVSAYFTGDVVRTLEHESEVEISNESK